MYHVCYIIKTCLPIVCFSNLYLGSSASFAASINLNLTPVPSRKLSFQGMGGVYHPGHPVSETGTDLLNLCRICQLPGEGEGYYSGKSAAGDILFSPCRCSGSLKYVHYSCLLVSSWRPSPVAIEAALFSSLQERKF